MFCAFRMLVCTNFLTLSFVGISKTLSKLFLHIEIYNVWPRLKKSLIILFFIKENVSIIILLVYNGKCLQMELIHFNWITILQYSDCNLSQLTCDWNFSLTTIFLVSNASITAKKFVDILLSLFLSNIKRDFLKE